MTVLMQCWWQRMLSLPLLSPLHRSYNRTDLVSDQIQASPPFSNSLVGDHVLVALNSLGNQGALCALSTKRRQLGVILFFARPTVWMRTSTDSSPFPCITDD